LAPYIIPYLGFFPYREVLIGFSLPHWINSLANFDGIHYLLISFRGYAQWEQAFFPLYPMLIKLLTPVFFNNGLLAGLIISNLSFLIGLLVAGRVFDKKYLLWFMVFLLLFPTSFFFGAVYTEGVFFFLFISSVFFLRRKNYRLAGLFAILSSLTRLIGVFLIIPIVFHFMSLRAERSNLQKRLLRRLRLLAMTIVSPLIGLTIYCFYLWKTTGDPLFFLTSQPIFGANRSANIILLPQVVWRYIKIFFTADHNFQYFISVLEFSIFLLVFVVLIFDLFKHLKINKNLKLKIENYNRLGLNLFSFANLILPTLTGTFSSVPRYVLFSLSFFIYLGEIENKSVKIILAVVFLIFHIILLGFFSQGYFIS
jgi:hypothetical protein